MFQQTFANFLPTTFPHLVQKWILSLQESIQRHANPDIANGNNNTHQTQEAAPSSDCIRVTPTLWHF